MRAINLSGGLEQRLGPWSIQLGGAYGRQKGKANYTNLVNNARLTAALADTNPATALNVFGDGSANNPATLDRIRGSYGTIDDYSNWSAALRADGPLFRLPAGDVRLAAGAEYRREAYDYFVKNDVSAATPNNAPYPGLPGPRHVKSLYAELLVPIFGPDNEMPGFRRLELSAAGRIEDYNQFGRTENPKFSLRWEPAEGIALRGSYGTSFRAPLFDELIGPALSLYSVENVPDPASPTGQSTVLALFGYAPNIQPEKATTWTAGFDIAPPSLPGLRASLTYYDVDYRDRIGTVTEDYLRFLSNRDAFGGVVIDNPPLDLVNFYFNQPTFFNPSGFAPTDIVAILDGQTRNLSAERQRGIDFDLGYAPQLAGGTLALGVSGTHIVSIKRQSDARRTEHRCRWFLRQPREVAPARARRLVERRLLGQCLRQFHRQLYQPDRRACRASVVMDHGRSNHLAALRWRRWDKRSRAAARPLGPQPVRQGPALCHEPQQHVSDGL